MKTVSKILKTLCNDRDRLNSLQLQLCGKKDELPEIEFDFLFGKISVIRYVINDVIRDLSRFDPSLKIPCEQMKSISLCSIEKISTRSLCHESKNC